MGGLGGGILDKGLNLMYGKAQVYTPPAVSDPAPLPAVASEVGDEAMRTAAKRVGRSKTIITGDLAPMSKGKKTLLGGM